MKKQFLIISLIVGLFLVVSGGVATAADIHNDKVRINSQADTVKEPALYVNQPEMNAPYRDSYPSIPDAETLVLESGDSSNPLQTLLIIKGWGDTEAELRFDNGVWGNPPDPTEPFSYQQAAIYTYANDYILRLKPGPFMTGLGLGEIRMVNNNGNIFTQIAAKTGNRAGLAFLKSGTGSGSGKDPGTDTALIYRPAAPYENDLRIKVADGSDVLQERMVINSGGNVGIGTIAPEAKLTVVDGSILALGTTGGTPVSGEGTRLMWIPAKAAFRAGSVAIDTWSDGTQWDDENIGLYSSAMGDGTTASGQGSTAIGSITIAEGADSFATGTKTTASGVDSTAMGYNTIASGNSSVAMGMDTYATGRNSFTVGQQATASGEHSIAMGLITTASGKHSIAMGRTITAAGENSFGIGLNNSSSTIYQASTMAIMGGKVGIGTVSPQSALAVSGLPTAAPDASGTAGALCVTNDGNIWIDSDGTYDCQ